MVNNNKTKIGLLVFAFLLLVGSIWTMAIVNTVAGMKASVEASKADVSLVYDKMWKVISQSAEIADHNAMVQQEAFQKIYPQLIEKRYAGKDPLVQFIQESNPQFDFSGVMYKTLQNQVESLREEFYQAQKSLVDKARVLKTYTTYRWPNRILLKNDTVPYSLILSTQTKEVVKTGNEDSIKVF